MKRTLSTLLAAVVAWGMSALGAVPEGWMERDGRAGSSGKAVHLIREGKALSMPVELPGLREIVLKEPSAACSLSSAERLDITFELPAGVPPHATVTVFSKDRDFLWRQIRLPLSSLKRDSSGRFVLEVPISGKKAIKAWQASGHGRPWTSLTPGNLLELGFRLELDEGQGGAVKGRGKLVDVTAVKAGGWSLGKVYDFEVNTLTPQVGKRLEASFRLDGWIPKPFDSSAFKIEAEVTLPGKEGKRERISGYYWEDFLYDEEDAEKTRCLKPYGTPGYRLRYVPRTAGRHTLRITVRQGKESLTLPGVSFEAVAPGADYHGFVHVDSKQTAFFAYEDGTVFRGLGMNVRSPFDDRYFSVAPYSMWRDKGLQAYEELFKNYQKLGINVAEVWMCSWWLALEWMNEAQGFHGVGHYNQYRAWMLDHIMDLAEKYGIHIILVLNNHGKFGMTYDTEWARNPYNKARGGYLDKCEDYFWHPRAKEDFKKTADYIVARWGASPYLLSWKLFTEVDLTGQNIHAYRKDKHIPEWHKEMGQYLKSIDVYKHPITTHWMLNYGRIDPRVARLKELDFLSTDAYYNEGDGTKSMVTLISGAARFARSFKKPMVITEFGGSSYADSMRNLMNQVEVGLWTGFFDKMGLLPMYWWFGLVEDKGLHGAYRCISRFEATEDRRNMVHIRPQLKGGNGSLQVHALSNKERALVWLMDSSYFNSKIENAIPELQKGKTLLLPEPQAGKKWQVEYWNPATGEIMGRNNVVPDGKGQLSVPLMDFRKSLLLKVLMKH